MKNQIVASIAALPFALGTVFAGADVANAFIIELDDVFDMGGELSYDGEGGALVGTDLVLDMILGIDTPANSGLALNCIDCKLNFTTGDNILEGPPVYIFGAGGSLTITGTVETQGGMTIFDVADGPFLTGSFTEDVVGLGTSSALTFTSIGVDQIASQITSYFGVNTNDFTFAQTSIAMSDVSILGNGGFVGEVDDVDMVNNAIVPEPATLFGLGVVTAGLVTSRRQKNS